MFLVKREAAVDSQSVETATMISTDVGYDAGKKVHGRKRQLKCRYVRALFCGRSRRVPAAVAQQRERGGLGDFCYVFPNVLEPRNLYSVLTLWEIRCSGCIRNGRDGGYRGEDFMRARDGYVTVECRNCSRDAMEEKGFCSFTKARLS